MSTLSSAALASNRLNARKSTGPRTQRGKAVAAANALRHGIFARDLLLSGESADELLTLKTAMIQRLNPRDPLELELIERVVTACWKIRRLQRFERLVYQQQSEQVAQQGCEQREAYGLGHRDLIPAEVAWQTGGDPFQQQLNRIENQQHRLENCMYRALRQLEKLRKEEIDLSPSNFAEDALSAEHLRHEKWRNEASEAKALSDRAQLADAKLKRAQLQIDREEESAAEGPDDDEPRLSPRERLRRRLFPHENWQNEAADLEQNEAGLDVASPDAPNISNSPAAESFERQPLPPDVDFTVTQQSPPLRPPSPCIRGEGCGEGLGSVTCEMKNHPERETDLPVSAVFKSNERQPAEPSNAT